MELRFLGRELRVSNRNRQLKNYRNTIEGAESYESHDQRVYDALLKITKENFKVVAIVTHGVL